MKLPHPVTLKKAVIEELYLEFDRNISKGLKQVRE
jgi:hypothetical protein